MDNKRNKIFTIFKALGFISLGVGILLIILGTVVFRGSFGDGTIPNIPLLVIGIFLIPISLTLITWGFSKKISAFMIGTIGDIQSENKDTMKNMANTNAEIHEEAITRTTKAIKDGIKDTKFCKHCGAKIDNDSKFCKSCGKEQ